MTQEQLNKWAVEQLQVIAGKLGAASDKLWELMLKQVQVEFWSNLVGLLIFAAATCFLSYIAYKLKSNDSFLSVTASIVSLFMIVILIFAICANLTPLYTAIMNPEYAALMKIMKMVGK